jgi:hypothetical protein
MLQASEPFHWERHPSLQVPRNVVSFQKARHLFENVRKCSKVPEVCIVEDSKIGIPLFRKNRPVLCLCQLLIGHGCPVSTLQNSEHNKHQQTMRWISRRFWMLVDDSGCLDDPVDCSVLFSAVLCFGAGLSFSFATILSPEWRFPSLAA